MPNPWLTSRDVTSKTTAVFTGILGGIWNPYWYAKTLKCGPSASAGLPYGKPASEIPNATIATAARAQSHPLRRRYPFGWTTDCGSVVSWVVLAIKHIAIRIAPAHSKNPTRIAAECEFMDSP